MTVVGNEPGRDARRVDADSRGARDGVARLSVRPPPGGRGAVELETRLGYPRGRSATRRDFIKLKR